MEQRIRFCTSKDGTRIAYSTIGSGPPLVKAATWLGHLQFDFDSPVLRHWSRDLARYHSFTRYDDRGCGLSDRDVESSTFENWVEDLEAVVDSLGLEKFALLGLSHGGALSIAYTARHPERVSHLILYGASALGRANARSSMRDLEELNAMLTLTRIGWGTGNPAYEQFFTSIFMPDGKAEERHWFTELQKKSTTPENAVRFIKEFLQINVQDLLPKITVPTLILHSRGDLVLPFDDGRDLATRIPHSHFVPLNSRNHILMEDEEAWKEFLVETRKFLGVSDQPRGGRDDYRSEILAQELVSLLEHTSEIELSKYRVVGSYTRYDEKTRNALKDLKQKIVGGLQSSNVSKHENYLIWARPGRGKTFFVNQVTETLTYPRPRIEKTPGSFELNHCKVEFVQLNLAEDEEPDARSILSTSEKSDKPYLLFVDEVDGKSDSSWPYETLLPYLDSSKTIPRVFVLAGSSGDSMAEMKSLIASRPKGADLISRIPDSNQFEIPSMTLGDKILVTLASLRRAGHDTGRDVAEVEKLALYYVAKNEGLDSARQLREFALRCLERMPIEEDRLKFDHLFAPGDQANKEFWLGARTVVPQLFNSYLAVRD